MLRAAVAAFLLSLPVQDAFAQASANEGWPASERLLEQYRKGNYAPVIAEAPTVLQAEPWNNPLRLAYGYSLLWSGREWSAVDQFRELLETDVGVDARLGLANGLAWTGRMAESLPHYRMLLTTKHAGEAKQGMANAYRWMGRDDLALPLYRELRVAYPDQEAGKEGLYYAERATRARTTFGFAFTRDTTPTHRTEPTVSHEWRDASKSVIFGLDASGGRDWKYPEKLERREIGFRVESLETPLSPRLSLSRQSEPESRTFGDLRLRVADWPLYVNAGHINWGKLSFTIPAIEQGLTANRFGVEGQYQTFAGELRGYANHFRISDDNKIDNGDVRLTPRWRPWGNEVKPYVGVHWRYSDHTDPDYWSPKRFVLGYGGVELAWGNQRVWTVGALFQAGFKVAGEASTSLSAFLSAKRWIGDDWAVGAAAFYQTGTREAGYRARGASITLEKLW
jgi:tetratricopeptide (TPR) repeat protein